MTASSQARPPGDPSPTAADLAARLIPLIDPCARMRTMNVGTASWQDAADLILIITQADMHLMINDLVLETGSSALDVSDALLGILRASVHPRAGSPTLREGAYRCLIAWAREMRAIATRGG